VVVCDDETPGPEAAARRDDLERVLRLVLAQKAELGDAAGAGPDEISPDPAVATWQAVGLAPLGPLDAQRVLGTDGVSERLEMVVAMLEDEASVLAQRLAGG
jgi:Lon protease-like protein